MPVTAHHDFETGSPVSLPACGVHRYAEHKHTRVWCMSYGFGDGLVYHWRPGYPNPEALLQHVANGGMMGVHNAIFERTIWNKFIRGTLGLPWPELKIAQQDCTQARAAALGLPQGLEQLGEVLGFKQQKDAEGALLMRKMMLPRKRHDDDTYTWWDAPENVDRLELYCDQDIRTETEADHLLLPLTRHERKIWELDQLINDRGVPVDEIAITRAVDVVLLAKKRADERMRDLTNGHVKKCSEVAKIVEWINTQGIHCDSMRKGDHDELMGLADVQDVPQVRAVIELRKEASKTSTAKYSKMLDCICADGRIRGLLNYHGAGPGRWAGRLVQPQNFPRVDPDIDGFMVEYTASLLSAAMSINDICDMIELGGYEPLPALSKSLRGMIACAA